VSEQISTPGKPSKILRGAGPISEYITKKYELMNEAAVYYAAKTGKLPISRNGKDLVTSEARIDRHYQEF
jgi:hypothetical protein